MIGITFGDAGIRVTSYWNFDLINPGYNILTNCSPKFVGS